jgi:hypothetical protein
MENFLLQTRGYRLLRLCSCLSKPEVFSLTGSLPFYMNKTYYYYTPSTMYCDFSSFFCSCPFSLCLFIVNRQQEEKKRPYSNVVVSDLGRIYIYNIIIIIAMIINIIIIVVVSGFYMSQLGTFSRHAQYWLAPNHHVANNVKISDFARSSAWSFVHTYIPWYSIV